MHPAWEEAIEEYDMDHTASARSLNSGGRSPRGDTGRSPRMDSARSRRSSASTETFSSTSTDASNLSEILLAMGLGRLPEASLKGLFSGAKCQDSNGAWSWPA